MTAILGQFPANFRFSGALRGEQPVFLDKMNRSIKLIEILTSRKQHISLSHLAQRLARKLLMGSINAQKPSTQDCVVLAGVCTMHSVEISNRFSNVGNQGPFFFNNIMSNLLYALFIIIL